MLSMYSYTQDWHIGLSFFKAPLVLRGQLGGKSVSVFSTLSCSFRQYLGLVAARTMREAGRG